jgi:hypothetical protein
MDVKTIVELTHVDKAVEILVKGVLELILHLVQLMDAAE